MNMNKSIVFLALVVVAGLNFDSTAKVIMSKAFACEILGVAENATKSEIKEKINVLRSQKVIRPAGYWTKVAKAYESITGKEFTLFSIRETDRNSFAIDIEKEMLKSDAAEFLGVPQTATHEEIVKRILSLRACEVRRQEGFWPRVAQAYRSLTGKAFDLFEINEPGILCYPSKRVKKMSKANACELLGVAENATPQEVEARIWQLRRQSNVREQGFWTEIARASKTLTGKKFDLFGIKETHGKSVGYDTSTGQILK